MSTEILILILLFGGISYFVHTGIELFSNGWSSYENKMLDGAEQTLDSMYLTIPTQHITYLALTCFFILSITFYILSGSLVAAMLMGTAGLTLPMFLLKYLKKKRDKTFGLQLVPALSNMGNALKAGLSLTQAIDLIHSEMDGPISQEFKLLSHELHFGETLSSALNNLEKRMPNQDFSLVVTAIKISTEVGGNLSEIFSNIATTIRERQALEAKVKSLTAQGKMQGTVMCMIPIGLGTALTVLYPEMMSPLYETQIGIFTMIFCVMMLIAGWFSIAKLTEIDF
jgi:tight adherence protein B